MTIYLLPNASKPRAFTVADEVANILADEGVTILADHSCAGKMKSTNPTYISEIGSVLFDMVLTIGGDGTILHAARRPELRDKPLIGVNIGRLGFLTIIETNELENLRRIPKGKYTIEHRSMLSFSCKQDEEPDIALNDVVFFKESINKTIALDIYCDDILVSSFVGDGVVFATPTGSTAYSMSAGGPIVDARLASITVSQICAHIVQTPPMVFDAGRTLRVVSRGRPDERVLVSMDGMANKPLPDGLSAYIHQSDRTVPLVQLSDADQLKSIDKKLKGR